MVVTVDQEGRRKGLLSSLPIVTAGRSWRELLLSLESRGLFGVEFVVRRPSWAQVLKQAIREILPQWQRCLPQECPRSHADIAQWLSK